MYVLIYSASKVEAQFEVTYIKCLNFQIMKFYTCGCLSIVTI